MQSNAKRNTIVSALVIGATALLIVGAVVVKGQSTNNAASTGTGTTLVPATKSSNNSSSTTNPSSYKNGTYSATGNYSAPGGDEQIGITMTISNGVVTSTSAKNMAFNGDSSQYEDIFISSYKDSVVGKNIDSLSGNVSGPSLTVIGFEDALSQIQNQAKV